MGLYMENVVMITTDLLKEYLNGINKHTILVKKPSHPFHLTYHHSLSRIFYGKGFSN